jgi:hypothetical protein
MEFSYIIFAWQMGGKWVANDFGDMPQIHTLLNVIKATPSLIFNS